MTTDASSASHGVRAALRHPPFGRLLATYAVNRTGDSIGVVALASLVYAETGSALATTALFLSMELLPAFLAPILTARVDRRDFRRVLPLLYLLEGLIFIALAIVAERFSLALILGLALADGVLMLTARGLTRAAVGAVLEPVGLLRDGNGLLNLAFAIAGVTGAALGGLLTNQLGASTALAIDGGTFLVAATLLVTARVIPGADTEAPTSARRLREGLGYVRRHVTLRVLLAGEGIALVMLTLIVPIEVVYAYETLGSDERGYGALMASWSGGLLAGSALFLRLRSQSVLRLAVFSTALIGAAYLGMGLVRELVAACALAVLGGVGNGIQWVAVTTAVQERTPAPLQARITGLLESIASGATGIGFVLGGVIVTLAAPDTAFLVAGIGTLAGVAAVATLYRPRLRRAATAPVTANLPPPPLTEPLVTLPVDPSETGAIAFLAQDLVDGMPVVSGYVSAGAPSHEVRAEMRDSDMELESALAWARNRAPVVLLRFAYGSDQYSVGSSPASDQYGAAHWKGSDASLLRLAEERATAASGRAE